MEKIPMTPRGQQMLKDVGIELKVDAMTNAASLTQYQAGEYHIGRLGEINADPSVMSFPLVFHLTGPAGRLVVVEGSNDLMSWLPIWTNTFAGALNFSDPQSGVDSNRFYRARLP